MKTAKWIAMLDLKNTLFDSSPYKNQIWALIYFAMATLFGSWFIGCIPLPSNQSQLWLSNLVSIGKWVIQIISALALLNNERWTFIRKIGFVYLIGSCLLLPYVVLSGMSIVHDLTFYNFSLLLSIMIMIVLYHRAVVQSNLRLIWWLFWIGCQIIAILLQTTIVFHVF
jgi:hypothetical protein